MNFASERPAELVKRLCDPDDPCPASTALASAAAIKALVRERDDARTLAIRRGEIQVRLQDEVRTERDRAEKAEAALAECMGHAEAMCDTIGASADCRLGAWKKFREWRAKHGK